MFLGNQTFPARSKQLAILKPASESVPRSTVVIANAAQQPLSSPRTDVHQLTRQSDGHWNLEKACRLHPILVPQDRGFHHSDQGQDHAQVTSANFAFAKIWQASSHRLRMAVLPILNICLKVAYKAIPLHSH